MTRRLPFVVRLRTPVDRVIERRGWLVEGPAGWGECSPLPSWSEAERAAAARSAEESARQSFPPPVRDLVEVNAMIPRVPPDHAAEMAAASACRTVKVKVGDDEGLARATAVRDAIGASGRLRLDANGRWPDPETALKALRVLAHLDIELVEDPVASLEELRIVRRRSPIPVAAEASVRTLEDARQVGALDAADAVVIKPQRIGGVRAAMDAADAAGVPAIASSALETSVGLAAVLAVAAALPDAPFAHGIGTALLLADDVTDRPLVPEGGMLRPRRVAPDRLLARADA